MSKPDNEPEEYADEIINRQADLIESQAKRIAELANVSAENRVMREYIHECGLSDDDIKGWVENFQAMRDCYELQRETRGR